MQHMRLGVFETRQAHRRRPAILQHGFYGCSSFFNFWHFWHFGIEFSFSLSTTQGWDESPGYFLAAGIILACFHILVFGFLIFHLIRFAEGSERASD
jgi:hypothetical protein